MQDAEGNLELAVAPGNPNVPVYFIVQEDISHPEEFHFMSFNATISDPNVFDVPSVCKDP